MEPALAAELNDVNGEVIDEQDDEFSPTIPSLAQRVQARERELQSEKPIDLEVPGYPMLVARYHPLAWKQVNKIQAKHRRLPEAEQNLYAAADYLIQACDDILERLPNDELRTTGFRWGRDIARVIWGKDAPSARAALLAIFPAPRDVDLVTHSNELLEESRARSREVGEELAGESGAGSARA